MNKDMEQMEQMKTHDVYEEVSTDTVDQETLHNAIDSRWAHKNKTPTEVRSRIVAKGYKEEVEDLDDIYASAPFFDMTGGEKVATEALCSTDSGGVHLHGRPHYSATCDYHPGSRAYATLQPH